MPNLFLIYCLEEEGLMIHTAITTCHTPTLITGKGIAYISAGLFWQPESVI
jgi:hypothetical protein